MRSPLLIAAILCATLAPAPRAQGNLELGKMWTFENPPLAYLEDEYGFRPDQAWLNALRMASLRFGGGCSASFVSPKGLIMTNHHCARGNIAQVSPPEKDWVKNGFYATALEDEVKLPGLSVQQLVKIEDVTAAMEEGITAADDEATAAAKRAANSDRIAERAQDANPGLTPQVVGLYQGAVHQLYLYKIYRDIRLVCAPHLQSAYFGGDPDNFTYPRFCMDFAFCRAYEDGVPADTSAHYFKWSVRGAKAGELVFVTGNPGSTARLNTKAQMDHLRDAYYPIVLQLIDNRLDIMRALASKSDEMEQALRTDILSLENAQKAYGGYHGALLNEDLMARKVAAEAEFKGRVMADPKLTAKFGKLWEGLEEVSALKTAFEPQRRFHTPGGSKHLERAVAIVRASGTSEPGADAVAAREMKLDMDPRQRAFFIDHLRRAADWLPTTDPYRNIVLGDRTAEQTAVMLETSSISDAAFVEELLAGGTAAVQASDDPAIVMARAIAPLMRARSKVGAWLAEQESALGVQIGRALFACYGNKVSPDATFTLRFSDGRVEGFPFNGTVAPYRTSFYGLYARNAAFDDEYPFDLPAVWKERKDRIKMTRAVNFVATNDIIGGNSGSPIVDEQLQVVGLIFDGNIEMLANRFLYTDEVPRSVSVHTQAIMEALSKIYDAERVVDELLGVQ